MDAVILAAGLGTYVMLVLVFELVFVQGAAPRWLEVLNLVGIVVLSALIAVASARHTLDQWLGSRSTGVESLPLPAGADAANTSVLADSPVLTRPPPALNRNAALRERLLSAMREGRAYAQEGLTVAQLAQQVESNPTHLREIINLQLGYRNFNDFLHHYRVDEAAQRLKNQDLPILSIALDVGYGSIGPFNRAFKQLKGLTPSEFRAQKG